MSTSIPRSSASSTTTSSSSSRRRASSWHSHPDTDDFFLLLAGRLTIQLADRDIELEPGELFVVPRGLQHCPKADGEAHVLLIEPIGTPNTGDAGGNLTADQERI